MIVDSQYADGVLVRPHLAAVVGTIALTALGATACGSSTSQTTTAAVASVPAPRPAHRARRTSGAPAVGKVQLVHAPGATLSVRVIKVIDPLADSGAALQPGTRAVGVIVQIENRGPAVYDSSATGDLSIVPTSGMITPVFAAHGVCQTPLRDFDNYITAGEVRHGCVAFAIDDGAKVAVVRFSPHGSASGRAAWATAG